MLPARMRGTTHDGLIAIADWHTTIVRLAGLDPTTAGETGAPVAPLDGVDAWTWLSGAQPQSDRRELVYMHLQNSGVPDSVTGACDTGMQTEGGVCARGALQQDGWKLVVGPEAQNSWYGWYSPNASVPFNKTAFAETACHPVPCLMNLGSMTEHEDVAAAHPAVVARLTSRFVALGATYHPPMANPALDLSGYCAAVARNGNFVGPWMRSPNNQTGGHAAWDAVPTDEGGALTESEMMML